MEYEEKVCNFKRYVKQSMDLLVDSYKWKIMAEECEDEKMEEKYMQVSHTLFDMFMTEHNNIGNIFKEQ